MAHVDLLLKSWDSLLQERDDIIKILWKPFGNLKSFGFLRGLAGVKVRGAGLGVTVPVVVGVGEMLGVSMESGVQDGGGLGVMLGTGDTVKVHEGGNGRQHRRLQGASEIGCGCAL